MNFNYLVDISFLVSFLIEVGLPIGLGLFIWKRFKVSWSIFFLGMVLFLASLIRIPLNNFLAVVVESKFVPNVATILTFVIASVTAGLFEEGARCIGIGAVIKNREYYKGVMYGVGHGGGGESMIFVGLSVLANYIVLRFLPHLVPQSSVESLKNMQWFMPLVGAGERLLAIAIQISLSVLIMHAFVSRKFYFVAVAFLYHAVVDFGASFSLQRFGIWITEGIVFGFALVSLAIIFVLKPRTTALPDIDTILSKG